MALTRAVGPMAQPALGTEQATTSGTSVDFTGIPAGVKMILVSIVGLSGNGTSPFQIQIGDSGGIESTAYSSVAGFNDAVGVGGLASSTGFILVPAIGAVNNYSFTAVMVLQSGTTWVCQANGHQNGATVVTLSNGHKTLSAELDRIRLTTVNGTDTFDAGSINIAYF